jgi:hypothetical protein
MFSIPVCAGCEKLIFNEYIQALDRFWHPECFRCSACGEAIKSDFNTRRGKIYHSECYQKKFAIICAACNQPIVGHYISAMGKKWHREHFTCSHCGQIIEANTFYLHDNKPYCQQDYFNLFTMQCAICQQPLLGEYSIDLWGNHYCSHHKDEYPTCSTCSRLICASTTGGGVHYHDGRQVCNICRKTAVDQPSAARNIYKEVSQVIASLGLNLSKPLSVKLVDQQELKRSTKKAHRDNTMGVTRNCITTQNGHETGRDAEILILHGLPRELFAATVAHEIGHSWLFLNHFPQLKPVIEEGFCELLSYFWLSQQKTPEASFRLQVMRKNRDLVYGRGYRAALRAYKKHSIMEITSFIRDHQCFPEA